jgi:hypothetical protein
LSQSIATFALKLSSGATGYGTTRGVGRTDHVEKNHRVAARHEVIVVKQRPAIQDAVSVAVLLELSVVPSTERGVVRIRIHPDRYFQALLGRTRSHGVKRDPVVHPSESLSKFDSTHTRSLMASV